MRNFKELLLKKTQGDTFLTSMVNEAGDEILTQYIVEALQKMAEPSAAMGRGANAAITAYGAGLDKSDVHQIRDAIGHHVSHYIGALKAMHGEKDTQKKQQFRQVADQHLNRIIPMLHTAARASKHSGGKLTVDYVSTIPWETNYTTPERRLENNKLKEGTKDLGRRPVFNVKRGPDHPRAVPDYRYLEMQPHEQHVHTETMPHKGGYPFEEIQIGHPEDVDAKRAYLHIHDVKNPEQYTPHPYDQHPIHAVADIPESKLVNMPLARQKFAQDIAAWKTSDPHKQWIENHKQAYKENPEQYVQRHKQKAAHVYESVPLIDQPHKAGSAMSSTAASGAAMGTGPQSATAATTLPNKVDTAHKKLSEGFTPTNKDKFNSLSKDQQVIVMQLLKMPEDSRHVLLNAPGGSNLRQILRAAGEF